MYAAVFQLPKVTYFAVHALYRQPHKLSGQGCWVLCQSEIKNEVLVEITVQVISVQRLEDLAYFEKSPPIMFDDVVRRVDLDRWVPFPPNWLLCRRPQAVEKPSSAPWGPHCWSAQFALATFLFQMTISPRLKMDCTSCRVCITNWQWRC